MERFEHKVYRLKNVTYLPHYFNERWYVAPGYSKYSGRIIYERELIEAGAKEDREYLWKRVNERR